MSVDIDDSQINSYWIAIPPIGKLFFYLGGKQNYGVFLSFQTISETNLVFCKTAYRQ